VPAVIHPHVREDVLVLKCVHGASSRATTGDRCRASTPARPSPTCSGSPSSTNVRLPTSFALVGKTLAQADSIARTLDPELDPVRLLDEEGTELMLREAERRLEPKQLFGYLFTQVAPAARLPRRVSQVAEKLGTGTLKVGIAPTELGGLERLLRSTANRLGAALIIAGLLVSSALMARVNETVSLVGSRR
jgi:predicted unusual protein kinase regulating ubiquinone biosynthesis (AarF/ABC1/UbiB family)